MEDKSKLLEIFAKNLVYHLERKNMAQAELARQLDVTASAVNLWCKGRGMPRMNKIDKICEILHIRRSDLLQERTTFREKSESVRLPVIGTIAGGQPIEAYEDLTDDWVDVPTDWFRGEKEFFALRVEGQSMAPRIEDGDIAIIQKTPIFESGDICAVYVNGYNATLKKVMKMTDGGLLLQPFNPAYEAKAYTPEECENLPVRIFGVMVEFRGKPHNN